MNNILVYGSKEFGGIVRNLVKNCNQTFIGYIDDFNSDEKDILGSFETVKEKYSPEHYSIVIAIGYKYLEERIRVYEKIKSYGYKVPTLVHPLAHIDSTASLGDGSIIMANSSIDYNSTIEELAVLWPGSIVSHDSQIGKNVFISPNATICGAVKIGSSSFIGAGSVVVDHKIIKPNSFIKAGSLN